MILPTKRLSPDRAMLTIGAEILALLIEPKTISRVWNELNDELNDRSAPRLFNYDWFILTLDLLYILGSIDIDHGKLRRINQ